MNDSYGDGWNGNAVEAYQNGALAGSATLTGGNNGIGYITVCSTSPVEFRFVTGSYPDEVSFTIYDGGDSEVYSSTSGSGLDSLTTVANACPTCVKPTGVYASVVDSTELTFVWDYEAGYSYMVSFDSSAFTVDNSGSYTAYGLTPNTLHTFAVKAICSLGDTSNAREVSMRTACSEMIIPYVEGFENSSEGDVPSCWIVVSDGVDGYPKVATTPHNGSNNLAMRSGSSNTAMIASSAIPLAGDSIYVSFYATTTYYGTLEAGMMTNPYADSTFVSLLTVPGGSSSPYALYEFNTSTLSHDSTYYLAFRYISSTTYYGVDIDDVTIRLDQGCITPTNVVATADTSSTDVAVSWNSTGAVTTFVVEYRAAGDTAWSNPLSSSVTNYTITGLDYSTTYEIRVGLVCGTDTMWAASTTATTICGLTQVPYSEDFDSYAQDVMPPCWVYNTDRITHFDGGVFWRTTNSNGVAAVLPQFSAPFIKLQIEFDAKCGTDAEGDGILIGAADAAGNVIAWIDTLYDPNHSRNAFVHHTYNFLGYDGAGTRIALSRKLNNTYDNGKWFLIDNITVIELTSCYPVDSLRGHNLDDVENTTFSWIPQGDESAWQVYYDTVTVTADSLANMPATSFIDVTDTFYTIPTGAIIGGGIYNFYVRANCGDEQSSWVKYEFGAGMIVMNNSATADTVTGCGMVVYDNGGPVAGYLENSNSALVIRSENAGMELEVFGGKFGFGANQATLTIYDGEGTTGTVLYTYNTINGRDTITDSVLAVSTTGALTITFTGGTMCHTGYELYIHCIGAASCAKPTNVLANMTAAGTAHASWDSTGATYYRVYHRVQGASIWNMNTTYTNSYDFNSLPADTIYEFYVVGICSATDSSSASSTRSFSTHWQEPLPPCEPVSNLQVTNITQTGAVLSWTSTGNRWEVSLVNASNVWSTTDNPYTLSSLTPNTEYSVAVRNICDVENDEYSDWSDTVTFTTLSTDVTMYTITVTSNNEAWGTVTGGGQYAENSSATITATPNAGYRFVEWQDGDENASRTVTVTADATYTATFAEATGIEEVENGNVTLFPNPANTTVTIRGIEGESIVTIVDLNGREVYRANANNTLTIDLSGYAKGAYFVRITGERTTAICKLIVK